MVIAQKQRTGLTVMREYRQTLTDAAKNQFDVVHARRKSNHFIEDRWLMYYFPLFNGMVYIQHNHNNLIPFACHSNKTTYALFCFSGNKRRCDMRIVSEDVDSFKDVVYQWACQHTQAQLNERNKLFTVDKHDDSLSAVHIGDKFVIGEGVDTLFFEVTAFRGKNSVRLKLFSGKGALASQFINKCGWIDRVVKQATNGANAKCYQGIYVELSEGCIAAHIKRVRR